MVGGLGINSGFISSSFSALSYLKYDFSKEVRWDYIFNSNGDGDSYLFKKDNKADNGVKGYLPSYFHCSGLSVKIVMDTIGERAFGIYFNDGFYNESMNLFLFYYKRDHRNNFIKRIGDIIFNSNY